MRHCTPSIIAALALLPLLVACASGRSADAEHADAMAREHARDAPVPSGAVQAPAQDVVGRTVVYGEADGRPLTGYLAAPVRQGQYPALLVIHEWWGLNDNIRAMTRQLAGEGYVALAVDMYAGEVAADPAAARELSQRVAQRPEAGIANLRAAANFVRDEYDATRVGVVGWCFGGGWSLRAAVGMPELIDAAVVYYGQPITDADRLARLDAPVLGLFGGDDRGIPVERVREMERTLAELGKDATVVVYPGAGHAFANPSGNNYNAEVAADAWERTTELFARHLKRSGS